MFAILLNNTVTMQNTLILITLFCVIWSLPYKSTLSGSERQWEGSFSQSLNLSWDIQLSIWCGSRNGLIYVYQYAGQGLGKKHNWTIPGKDLGKRYIGEPLGLDRV